MRIELADKNEPKKGLTVKGGAERGRVVIMIEGTAREVDAGEITRAVNVCRNSPEKPA